MTHMEPSFSVPWSQSMKPGNVRPGLGVGSCISTVSEFALVLNTLASGRVRRPQLGSLGGCTLTPAWAHFMCVGGVCLACAWGGSEGDGRAVCPCTAGGTGRVCLVFWSPRGSPGLAKSCDLHLWLQVAPKTGQKHPVPCGLAFPVRSHSVG